MLGKECELACMSFFSAETPESSMQGINHTQQVCIFIFFRIYHADPLPQTFATSEIMFWVLHRLVQALEIKKISTGTSLATVLFN